MKAPLSKRLEVHADNMHSEGWYTTANVLAEAAEALADWTPGNMTSNQYRKALEALGMSQQAAANFFGVSLRTSQGYALGEYPVPEAVAKLLRLMIRLDLKPEDVR